MINRLFRSVSSLVKPGRAEHDFWESADIDEWGEFGYPMRPSKVDLKNMGIIIDGLKNKSKVGLMGSTPEIRKLMAKRNIHIDVIDFSKKMYLEMGKISKSFSNETFINSDWVEYISAQEQKYDLIVGDLIERLLPKGKLIKLCRKLFGALKNDGKILLRGDYYIPQKKSLLLSFRAEVQRLKKLQLTDKEISDWMFFGLSREFINRDSSVNLQEMRDLLKNIEVDYGSAEKKIVDLVIQRWTGSPLSFYCRTSDQLELIWRDDFKRADARIEEQIFTNRWVTIELWQKKNDSQKLS